MKILNIKALVILIILIVLLFVLYTVAKPTDKINEKNIETISYDSTEQDTTNKITTIVQDPQNPKSKIFQSPLLGVSFRYLNDGSYGSYPGTPNESKDFISLDSNNYIKLFHKSADESIENALKRLFPEEFNNKFCAVFKYPIEEFSGYIIWDNRFSIDGYGADNKPGVEFGIQNGCSPKMNSIFITNPRYPDLIYYIEYETQAVSYWADDSHSKIWWQTINLFDF